MILLVPCLLDSVGVTVFFSFIILAKHAFRQFHLSILTFRKGDEVTSWNLRFREFHDLIYHFYIIFSFEYTL